MFSKNIRLYLFHTPIPLPNLTRVSFSYSPNNSAPTPMALRCVSRTGIWRRVPTVFGGSKYSGDMFMGVRARSCAVSGLVIPTNDLELDLPFLSKEVPICD